MSYKDIKKITGFSYATISRVLTGRAAEYRISQKTIRKINTAAARLQCRPNILARSLRTKKTWTIGLILSDIQNSYFGNLGSRIERHLRDCGYSTILCNSNESPKNEQLYLNVLVDRQVDGIILAPTQTKEDDSFKKVRKSLPIVLIDRSIYKTRLPSVTSQNEKAGERLTRSLIRMGYKRIAFLGGIPNTYITEKRYLGYKTALRKYKIASIDRMTVFKDYSLKAGEEMMGTVLDSSPDLEAVLCVNNHVFLGAVNGLREYEKKSRRSIMMAAFDIYPAYLPPFGRPFLSADQDIDGMANSSVKLLLAKIKGSPIAERHIQLPLRIRSNPEFPSRPPGS
jgi:LacI family transcriptional regulator